MSVSLILPAPGLSSRNLNLTNPQALRLNPVIPSNSRTALVDTVLPLGGGPSGTSPLFIPRGGVVSWSLYSMHRRSDIYGENAEAFDPERWDNLRPGWGFLPFNGGVRVCLGREFFLSPFLFSPFPPCFFDEWGAGD